MPITQVKKKDLVLSERTPFMCPFCGLEGAVGYFVSGPIDIPAGAPVAIHEKPFCDEYTNMELLDFMKAMNEKIAARPKA